MCYVHINVRHFSSFMTYNSLNAVTRIKWSWLIRFSLHFPYFAIAMVDEWETKNPAEQWNLTTGNFTQQFIWLLNSYQALSKYILAIIKLNSYLKTHTHTQNEGKRLFLQSWMVWWVSYYSGTAYSSLWFCLPREDLVTFQMLWVATPSIPHQWLYVARARGNCCSATSRAVIDRQPSCIAICQFLSVPASIVSNESWLVAV